MTPVRILLVLLATSAPLLAAALKPYDAVIPNAFERNHGQSLPAFEYLVTHRNIGFSCQAMYWPDYYHGQPAGGRPFTFRIAGATAGCSSQLLDADGTNSIYYRGANNAGGSGPHSRFARLHFTQSQADIEYRGTADSVVAQFSFRSIAAFRAFRLLWESSAGVYSLEPGILNTSAGPWKVRASAGAVEISVDQQRHEISFDVSGVTGSVALTLIIEMPTPPIPLLAEYFGVVDTRGNWYKAGSVAGYSQFDASAVLCFLTGPSTTRCPDAFVAKFGPDAALRYLVYFLGNSRDAANSVHIDSGGYVYVSGVTYSTDFVTTPGVLEEGYSGPFESLINRLSRGGDSFLAKLTGEAGDLIYSTYFGFGQSEYPLNLHADALGRTYLRIDSQSPDFPTWGNPITALTSCSVDFVTKLQTCSYLVSLDENAAGLRYSKSISPYTRIGVTADGEVVTPALRISADGEPVSAIDIPDSLQVINFALAPDAGIWVAAYRQQPDGNRFVLGRVAPGASHLEIVREGLPVESAMEIDSGGNLWITLSHRFLSLSNPPFDFAPTSDALLLTPCPNCDGLIKLSASGELLFATYLPFESSSLAIGPNDEVRVYEYPQRGNAGRIHILDRAARSLPLISSIQDLSQAEPQFKAGNVLTIFGMAIGPADPVIQPLDSAGRVSTETGGVRVLVDGRPSPILAADSSRITFMVSHQTPDTGSSTLVITRNGETIVTSAITLGGRGHGVLSGPYAPPGSGVFNEDGTLNSEDNPAEAGSVVRFYLLAAGPYDQPLIDGELHHTTLAKPILPIRIQLGRELVELLSIGQAPDKVAGMIETRIRTPLQVSGNAPVAELEITPFVENFPRSHFPGHSVYVAR